MLTQSILHTWRRYRTLRTNRITALPIVILMPHSACNCRCVMCDIWKGNKNTKQLTEEEISGLLSALKKFGTRQVLLSGGEALLHHRFFSLCSILKSQKLHLTLLSTGLTLKIHAEELVKNVDDIIVSVDGDELVHDGIRNIPGAFRKLKEGIEAIKKIDPHYPISARSVVHRLNYSGWNKTVDAAHELGLDSISFLPADVSSEAFNRHIPWSEDRQHEVLIPEEELPLLRAAIESLINLHAEDFDRKFIVESREKIRNIATYYEAIYGLNEFPEKKCNAPWISAVIEADGNVRPCFFHPANGNIKDESLESILNNSRSLAFRRSLDPGQNTICKKCVCSLSLPFHKNPVA